MAGQPSVFPLGLSTVFWTVQEEEDKTMGPQSCEGQACMLGCLKDLCMGREQQNLPAEVTAAPALLRSGRVQDASSKTKLPNHQSSL